MGSAASSQAKVIAKSKQQLKKDAHPMSKDDPIRWQELKKRQASIMDTLELSSLLAQPVERMDFIIQFLENKGIFVEQGLLGQGGCGFILRAFNEKKEKLAVKLLRCVTKDQIQVNKQEYAVLSQFNSEYVTKVYDQLQFEFDSAHYLVILMERCAYDLLKFLTNSKVKGKKKPPGIRELLKMAEQMVQGLIVLHSKDIIHLDIKPANILFGLDKVWKYADLGVSRKLTTNKQHISHMNGYTVDYSSPEQYQLMSLNASRRITKKSDIYSLGIVFMELTGVEIQRKWLIQQKTQSMVVTNEHLNTEFPEFNERVIIPMVKYHEKERIELNQLLVTVQDMLEGKARPVDTLTIQKEEEEQISLLDQDDPLNFDSHQYQQIRIKYQAERQQHRNSMGTQIADKIRRDEQFQTIQQSRQRFSQPATTQEYQEPQQDSPLLHYYGNKLEKSPSRFSKYSIPAQFMGFDGEQSQNINARCSLNLEDKKIRPQEQPIFESPSSNTEIVLPILRLSDSQSQTDKSSSLNRIQTNHFLRPAFQNSAIRKSSFGFESSPTSQEQPRLSMYGQRVLDQSPINQQSQYPQSPSSFRAYTQQIEDKDDKKLTIMKQVSSNSQGQLLQSRMSTLSESRYINQQSPRRQQQSQLATIAQMQFFQNNPR